jgi:hypothetical protein
MKVGLIVNPRSGRASGRGLRLQELLRRDPHFHLATVENFCSLPAVLRDFAASGVNVLVISSGDGTIQAVQTELAERNPFSALPELMLLAHGTTNMTAADLGLGMRDPRPVASILSNPFRLQSLARRRRPTLRVTNPGDGGPRHGMFLGTGCVYRSVRLCQNRIYASGTRGNLAIVATLTAAIVNALIRPDGAGPRLAGPYRLRLCADGIAVADGDQTLFLATTLDRLVLGTRPFWGGKSAPLRATLIPYPVPRLMRSLWSAMYGPEDRCMPPGSVSLSARTLDIWTTGSFVIDGEFFQPPQADPLHIEAGPEFTYLSISAAAP